MMATEQTTAQQIREAYDTARAAKTDRSAWVRIATIQAFTGLAKADLAQAITELMADEHFRAEPEPHRHRITADDRRWAVRIGGEDRHLISWT